MQLRGDSRRGRLPVTPPADDYVARSTTIGTPLLSTPDIIHPVSYIYKVGVSATLRAIRRTKARREDQLHDDDTSHDGAPADGLRTHPDASPHAVAERREWVRTIDRAMTRLAANRRRAVGLHLRGMTTREIGRMLGWSEPKARNLVQCGLRDLRDHLRSEGVIVGG